MDDDEPLTPEQARVLLLLTADPDTWDLGEAPDWLARECAELRLAVEIAPGQWRKTILGHEAAQSGGVRSPFVKG